MRGFRPSLAGTLAVTVMALAGCVDSAAEARMRGNVYMRAGEADQALEAYREAVRIAPERGRGHQLLANALQETGAADEAVDAYRTAMGLSAPSSTVGVESRRELGILLFHAGRAGAAKDRLREVLQFRPDDVFTMNRLAEIHASLGEIEEARAMVSAVIHRDPDNIPGRMTRARLGVIAEDWEAALGALEEIRSRRPGEAFVDYEVAAVRALRGDGAGAVAALKTALAGASAPLKAAALKDIRLRSLRGIPAFQALIASER